MNSFTKIADAITQQTGKSFEILTSERINGGDINTAYRISDKDRRFFVKLNQTNRIAMFEAEAEGLGALAACRSIRVPIPICTGQTAQHAFIVLEYLAFGAFNRSTSRMMGVQLAQLHQQPQSCFGWHHNNTIGSTLQINTQNANWIDFWREHRLDFQLKLAAQNGYHGKVQQLGEQLCSDLGAFFSPYQPVPSLLHGDLWGGNAGVTQQGEPVIFDPACYFGDHEADLAMTELFGGFNQDFYSGYSEIWPLDPGYNTRKSLYNLYHILNHLNLFGGSYLSQAERMMGVLLAEIR